MSVGDLEVSKNVKKILRIKNILIIVLQMINVANVQKKDINKIVVINHNVAHINGILKNKVINLDDLNI